jgi:hypothetical protein
LLPTFVHAVFHAHVDTPPPLYACQHGGDGGHLTEVLASGRSIVVFTPRSCDCPAPV